jgi:hypothetical protein
MNRKRLIKNLNNIFSNLLVRKKEQVSFINEEYEPDEVVCYLF